MQVKALFGLFGPKPEAASPKKAQLVEDLLKLAAPGTKPETIEPLVGGTGACSPSGKGWPGTDAALWAHCL